MTRTLLLFWDAGGPFMLHALPDEPELVLISSIELDLFVRADPCQARPVATNPGRAMEMTELRFRLDAALHELVQPGPLTG